MDSKFIGAAGATEIISDVLFVVAIVAFAYWVAYLIWYNVYRLRAGKAEKNPTNVNDDNVRNFLRFNKVTARKSLPSKQRRYLDNVFIVDSLKRPSTAASAIFVIAGLIMELSSVACVYFAASYIAANAAVEGWTAFNVLALIVTGVTVLACALSAYYYSHSIMLKSLDLPLVYITMNTDEYKSAAYTDVKTAVPETAALDALKITRNDVVDCGAYDFMCRETDGSALVACNEDMSDFRASAYTAVYAFCTAEDVCVYTRRHDVVYDASDEPKIIHEPYSNINAVTLTQEYRPVKLDGRYTTIPRTVTRITLDCKDGTKYFEFDVLNQPTKSLADMLCRKIDELRPADVEPAFSADSISGE